MDTSPQREPEINWLLRVARKYGASDLYLRVGSAPLFQWRGVTRRADMLPLSPEDLERFVRPLLYAEQWQHLGQGNEVTFLYAFEEGEAYRMAVSSNGGQLNLSAHRQGG